MAGTERSKREAARERVLAVVRQALDRYIPGDGSQPVKDGRFWEWEELADRFEREVTGVFLEELAQLSAGAVLAEPGPCPHCGSGTTKWLEVAGQRERQSKHGPVVLPRQVARCRPCGRSFSPSGGAVGSGPADAHDAASPGETQPGGGGAAL